MTLQFVETGLQAEHPRLGVVRVVVRANSRRFSARWKKGEVVMNVPARTTLQAFNKALEELAPRLEKVRPDEALFEYDKTLVFPLWSIVFKQSDRPGNAVYSSGTDEVVVLVPRSLSLSDPDVVAFLSKIVEKKARRLAYGKLIPFAREVARELGVSPGDWKISDGRRTLGTCSSEGIISLSYFNMFLPERLCRYIICHELAHLFEMNHGSRFHEICNRYCGGREKELRSELKKFAWPVLR